jgi:fermentation-respiration switch protein FrsA (DUF1100 family)
MQRIQDTPILFLSGLSDEMIPPQHMRQLFDLAVKTQGDSGVALAGFEHGTQKDTCMQDGYFDRIAEFIKKFLH